MSGGNKMHTARAIDARAERSAGGESLGQATGSTALPSMPTLPPPTNLRVDVEPYIDFSAYTSTATIGLSWIAPTNAIQPDGYLVQRSLDSAFTISLAQRETPRGQTSITFDRLPTGQTVYFRVAAIYRGVTSRWSNVVSRLTPVDLSAPGPVTLPTVIWSTADGGLSILWNNPTSANFQRVLVEFFQAGGGGTVLYATWSSAPRFTLPIGMQRTLAGFPRTGYQIRLTSYSSAGTAGTPVLVNATWTRPANPSVSIDFTGRDAVFTASAPAGVVSWEWTIDGAAITPQSVPVYTYTYAENVLRHGGTPDPSLSWSVVVRDLMGFTPTAAAPSGTATNAPPAATTLTVGAGAFDQVQLTITPSTAADVDAYRIWVYKDDGAVAVDNVLTRETRPLYQIRNGNGSYQFAVQVVDAFGQASTLSALTTAQALIDRAQFIADLRASAIYSDSVGTSPDALKEFLSDDVYTSGGPTYAAGLTWKWTQLERVEEDRYWAASFRTNTPIEFYLAFSRDGSTWTYYSAPLVDGKQLTLVADETAARAAPVNTGDTPLAGLRIEIPGFVSARFVRIWHRKGSASYAIREFYPRRLLQADDLRVESLAAISANLGAITAGTMTAVTIIGSTITGSVIQTATTGARAVLDGTGLKTFDALGNVQVEATTATDGALRAGAGTVLLNKDGIGIAGGGNPTTLGAENELRLFAPSTTTRRAGLGYGENTTEGQVTLEVRPNSTRDAYAVVQAVSPSTSKLAFATLTARDASSTNSASVDAAAAAGGVSVALNVNGVPRVRATTSGVELAGTTAASLIELTEIGTPSAPGADKGRLFVRDNGAGKSQLCILFASGAVQVIATQP